MHSDIIQWIDSLTPNELKSFKRLFIKKFPQINIPSNSNFSESVYKLLYSQTKCICGNDTKFLSIKKGYAPFCSTKCAAINNTESRKQTNLIRYGVENISQLSRIKEKKISTSMSNYGVEYHTQSIEGKEARKKTNLEKYGVEHVITLPEIQQKIYNTKMEKHGYISPFQLESTQNDMKEKRLLAYGVEYPLQSPIFREKAQKTLQKKYQVKNISQVHLKEVLPILDSKEELQQLLETYSLTELVDMLNVSITTLLNRLTNFGLRVRKTSFFEEEIIIFLKSLGISNIIQRTRQIITPKELDIFLPEYNIAIECCGLYWHSTKFKDPNAHMEKYKQCEKQNIQLITIFSDDWYNKMDICKSRLRAILNIKEPPVMGRKTSVKVISKKDAYPFLIKYHMQGYCKASIHLGLYLGNELLSVMSFSKVRFTKQQGYEIIRYASAKPIIGGQAKLLKYFISQHTSCKIFSYVDLCWGNGKSYEKLQFSLVKYTSPNYWYLINGIRISRTHYTKKKLVAAGYDVTLSENLIMADIPKLYNCGNKLYVFNG